MLRLQAVRAQVPVAQLVELVGEEGEHSRPVVPGGVAAVPVPLPELLQLVVQISHDGLLGVVDRRLASRRSQVVVGVFVR